MCLFKVAGAAAVENIRQKIYEVINEGVQTEINRMRHTILLVRTERTREVGEHELQEKRRDWNAGGSSKEGNKEWKMIKGDKRIKREDEL
jgi:hypothetical protein